MYFSMRNACVTSVVRLNKCWPRTTETLSFGGLWGGGSRALASPLGPGLALPAPMGASVPETAPRSAPGPVGTSAFPSAVHEGPSPSAQPSWPLGDLGHSALPGLRPSGKRLPRPGQPMPSAPWGSVPPPPGRARGWAASERRAGDPGLEREGIPAEPLCPLRGGPSCEPTWGAQESEPRPQPPSFFPVHICPVPDLWPACPHQAWPRPAPPSTWEWVPAPLPQPLNPQCHPGEAQPSAC